MRLPGWPRPLHVFLLSAHEIAALITLYFLWRHLNDPFTPAWYTLTGLLLVTALSLLLQIGRWLWFHRWLYHGMASLSNTFIGDFEEQKVEGLLMQVSVPFGIQVRPGQHVGLRIPRAGLRATLRSHSFFVVDTSPAAPPASRGVLMTLIALAEVRLTRRLLALSTRPSQSRTVYLEPPHGTAVDLKCYDLVIMIATGWGMIAHLPFLRVLADREDIPSSRASVIIWQLQKSSR